MFHVEVFRKIIKETCNLVARLDAGQDEDHRSSNVSNFAPEGVVGVVRVLVHRQEAGPCRLHAEHNCAEYTRDHDDVLRHPEAGHCAENEGSDFDVRVTKVFDEIVSHRSHEHAPQDTATSQSNE